MSIPFGQYFGVGFTEAVVVLESLKEKTFEDSDKEKQRLSLINYIESKMWSIYPYLSEDYFHGNPTPRKEEKTEGDRAKSNGEK